VLGAGRVAAPLVRYLLDRADLELTVVDRFVERANALVDGQEKGRAVALLTEETDRLEELIRGHDLCVSLLPAPQHPLIAERCIKHRRHLVTTSYISPRMRELDGPARQAGVMLLNETGLDPGIDHMSAMRIIHDVERRGGEVVSFRSYCGGLPAPEANDNPWGYKFSWSPRAVCTAGKNAARYRENGNLVDVPGPELFAHHHPVEVEGLGTLEAYPNRDSLSYLDLYGLQQVHTMFRGTLRYSGWCETLKQVVDLGLLDETPVTYPAGTTYARYLAGFLESPPTGDLRRDLAGRLGLAESSPVLDRFEWLGLLSDEPLAVAGGESTPLDALAERMVEKMSYGPGERDMVVLYHSFEARFPSAADERISSVLIDYGRPDGDSAMARTVGLPAAVTARLIVTGQLALPGVHLPVLPEIYKPVLAELASMGICSAETTTPLKARSGDRPANRR